MKKHIFIAMLVSIIACSGCAFTQIQLPLDKNFDNTQLGLKEGRASAQTVLFLIAWGDSGTKAAAENGGITVIKHADREIYSFLFGLFTRVTTVVYGE